MTDRHARLTLAPVSDIEGEHPGRALLVEARQQMHMVPNMYTNMAHAPALLETYRDGYTRFRASSGFTPVEQELVLLVISHENGCTYCTAAHGFLADKVSGVPREDIRAVLAGRPPADDRLAALATLTREMVAQRGWPAHDTVRRFLAAGYTQEQVLHVLLAIAVKTISNYANHLFDTPVDGMFAAHRDALAT